MVTLNHEREMKSMIEIGTILLKRVSDGIKMSLDGTREEINPHDEAWIILDYKKDTYLLHNLVDKKRYKMSDAEMNYLLKHKILRVNKERGKL